MNAFKGQRVFVTGGSSGIGLATARLLVQRGAHVCIAARGRARLQQAEQSLTADRPDTTQVVAAVALDVSDRAAVVAASAQVLQTLGGIDLLICSAGIAYCHYEDQTTPEVFTNVMATNFFGTVWCVQAFLPTFRAQRRGVIAGVASTVGYLGIFGYTAYAASKHAVVGYLGSLRQELWRHNVGVSVLAPPDTDTPQWAEENKTKPAETKALAGKAGLVSAAFVAEAFLAGLARRQQLIIPGYKNKLTLAAARHCPKLLDWAMRRELHQVAP